MIPPLSNTSEDYDVLVNDTESFLDNLEAAMKELQNGKHVDDTAARKIEEMINDFRSQL